MLLMLLLPYCFQFWAQFLKLKIIFCGFYRQSRTLYAAEAPEQGANTG